MPLSGTPTRSAPPRPSGSHSLDIPRLRPLRVRLRRLDRCTRALLVLLKAGCALTVVYYFGAYAWVVWSRARYPFDLEWMEGAMVDHVRFLLAHGNIYTPPSIEFVPYLYNPLYYVVAASLSWITGVDYFTLRLVSILASLACFALIYRLVSRETRDPQMGLVSSGLFAATYALSGGWFDIARVDSLSLALGLAAIYGVRFAAGRRELVTAAAFVWLAFEAKQSAVGLLLPLALYLFLFQGWRRGLWFLIPGVLLVGGSVVTLNLISHGWYGFYTLLLPSRLANYYGRYLWRSEIFGNLPVALALGFTFFAARRSPSGLRVKAFHGLVALSLLVVAARVRAHAGSWLNDNMPAHAALAILGGLGAGALLSSTGGALRARRLAALTYAALLFQFLFLAYDPRQWVPTQADRSEGERLVEMLRATPGPVLLTHRGFLGWREGKGSFAHQMAVSNLFLAPDDLRHAKSGLASEFERAFEEKRFAAVITDFDDFQFAEDLRRSYRPAPPQFVQDPKAFRCLTGARLKPEFLYVPK